MQEKSENTITIGLLVSWVLGSLFLLTGLIGVIEGPIMGFCMLVASGFLLPPVRRMKYPIIKATFGANLSGGARFFLVIIIIYIGVVNLESGSSANSIISSPKTGVNKILQSLMEEEFIGAFNGKRTIFSKQNWLSFVGFQGATNAFEVTVAFTENEVAASEKYKGRWMVEGVVKSINDSVGKAIISMAGAPYHEFHAEVENKSSVVHYKRHLTAQLFCEGIRESISMVYGQKCFTLSDFAKQAARKIIANPPDVSIASNGKDLNVRQLIRKMQEGLDVLGDDSDCLQNFESEKCKADLKKAFSKLKLDEKF